MIWIWFRKIDKNRAKQNILLLILVIYYVNTEFHWSWVALISIWCVMLIDNIYERTVKDWTYTPCIYFI